MALDQEYYEKALVILQSKGFSDKEADQIATTLSVYLPMRFIQVSAWEEIPVEHRPENAFAVVALGWYNRIPELRKPTIYKMPSDLTYTTYGQEYEPGADSPVYTTGPDGYTHHPVGWENGITGVSGIAGPSGDDHIEVSNLSYHHPSADFRYQVPAESMLRRFTVVMKIGGKVSEVSLEELIDKMGGYDKLPASARAAIDHVMEAYRRTPVELGGALEGELPAMSIRTLLPNGVTQEQAKYLKLNDLGDIEGIKRAYPNITEEEAERLSDLHHSIAKRASAFSSPERQPSLFERLMDPEQYGNDLRHNLDHLNEKAGPRCVSIQTSCRRVLGGGLVIETPLFGQSYKNPTGPQTMPGLEKGPNGKPHRRKKGKGKRYERGY